MHSNVGGGYPDDDLAHVSLRWMIGQVQRQQPADSGLDFNQEKLIAIEQRSHLQPVLRRLPRVGQCKTLSSPIVPVRGPPCVTRAFPVVRQNAGLPLRCIPMQLLDGRGTGQGLP